jgi:signal transduction histidine kinase
VRKQLGGLVPRILLASVVIAVLVCAALTALLVSVVGSHRSLERQSHSKDVSVAAVQLDAIVSDLDAALRGYVATREDRFFGPWRQAREQLPTAERRLEKLVADDNTERALVASLNASIHSYVETFAVPLLGIARLEPKTAASPLAQVEDKRRVDSIRAGVDQVLTLENGRAAARAHSVRVQSNRALAIGLTALAASGALILLFGTYLALSVARPIRRAASAAGDVASGDFSVRLPANGPGEVAGLAHAFNAMAGSLDESRRELLHQNELLKDAELHKSELISMVSHEVRTPLASLLGFTDLLLNRDLDSETQRRYLQIVHQESRRLASLTRDFLDVRLLEEGRLELVLTRVDLAEIAREQAQVFVTQSTKHPLVLDLPQSPVWVEGDRDRLSQVVGNLVANAIKYSPDGGAIEIRCKQTDGRTRLELEDHGVGIPLEDQPMIFTKFYRGHAAASGIPGTGLGLAIAQQLAVAHGGTLEFDSTLGHGTTFRLELPLAA